MAQPNKGDRRQIKTRIPESMVGEVLKYASADQLTMSEAIADLVATALNCPLPSQTLPRPKSRQQHEELPLGMTA